MKKFRRLSTLILVSLLTATLNACGNTDSSPSSNATTSSPSSSTTTSSTSESEEASVSTSDEVILPLCDEKTTLTFFQQLNDNSVVNSDYNDVEAFQELEKRTNVHIEWQMSSSVDFQTNFNLMISSNQIPDIMAGAEYYNDGLEAGADDGYFLDLTDMLEEYAPHYYTLANSNETFRVKTKTDSGRYIALYPLMQSPQGPWCGLMIRQDWLDELGMDTPVTYDDWHEVLTAFKNEIGCSAPLYLPSGGYMDLSRAFMAGFGVDYTWQITADGSVAYGPYLDGWKEYVTLMNQWFEEGLIDPDFMVADLFADTTYVVTGKSGAFVGIDSMGPIYMNSCEDPDCNIVPVHPPVQNEGDEIHLRNADQVFSGSVFAIGATSKNPELALRWVDYLFTDEGALLANYGIEGDTFTYSEDGKYQLTDKIMNNETLSPVQAQYSYCLAPNAAPYYYDWTRGLLLDDPDGNMNQYMALWIEDEDDWVMPAELSLTADESVERASIMTDIESFMQENTTAMISGAVDIETTWESYQQTMESLGIARATEITQAAYDRYLQR